MRVVQGGGAFRRREAGYFAVYRVGEERIEGALEAEEHTDRPHAVWPVTVRPSARAVSMWSRIARWYS